jgi:DNA-binding Lrp family transcriptional regulator
MASTTEAQRAARRREVAKRLRLGESYAEIAEALDVSKSTVGRDVQRLRQRWRAEVEKDMREHMAERLAELKAIKRDAYRAWLDSREGPSEEKVRTKGEGQSRTAVGEDGELQSESVVTDVEHVTKAVTRKAGGDPRHLRVMLAAEKRIAEIIGVAEAPTPTGDAGDRISALVGAIEATAQDLDDAAFEGDVDGPA